MGKYIKKFTTHAEYESYINGGEAILPNVSTCDDQPTHVHYNPYKEPATELVVTYYVENTSYDTKLNNSNYGEEYSSMIIDGVLQSNVVSLYKFNTTGEHTVVYELSDPTDIGSFANCPIVKIVIPDTVTEINDYAFYQCDLITSVGAVGSDSSVEIPYSVTSIGNQAFSGCHKLSCVTIPSSIQVIGNEAFEDLNTPIITFESTTPPAMGDYCLGTSYYYYKVLVPCEALDEYVDDFAVSQRESVEYCVKGYGGNESTITIIFDIPSNDVGRDVRIYNSHYGREVSEVIVDGITLPCPVNTYRFETDGEHEVILKLECSYDSVDDTLNQTYNAKSVVIGEGIKSIGSEFKSPTTETLVLPSTIESIKINDYYSTLASMTIYATTPPTLEGNFDGLNCPIYVPSESVEAYKNDSYWNTYRDKIVAIP